MIDLVVVTRDGIAEQIGGEEGMSLLEAIRNSGNDELQALCGGTCSCATCHVIVDDAWIDRTGHAGADEQDLLEGSLHQSANSRLSCQITLRPDMSGLRVAIAPQD